VQHLAPALQRLVGREHDRASLQAPLVDDSVEDVRSVGGTLQVSPTAHLDAMSAWGTPPSAMQWILKRVMTSITGRASEMTPPATGGPETQLAGMHPPDFLDPHPPDFQDATSGAGQLRPVASARTPDEAPSCRGTARTRRSPGRRGAPSRVERKRWNAHARRESRQSEER
jgi:hypothetical protein